jgi:hypothetical protein
VAPKPDTPPDRSKRTRKLAPGVRIPLALLGAALIGLAAYLWLSPPPPTIQITTHRTVEQTVAPANELKQSSEVHTTAHSVTSTDEILNGRQDQAKAAQPGSAGIRSDTATVALLTVGTLLVILAAIPTLPTKLGFGTASMEWSAEEVAQASAAATVAAVNAGVQDPRVVGNVAKAVVHRAESEKAKAPDAQVDWSYVAAAAVNDVVRPSDRG